MATNYDDDSFTMRARAAAIRAASPTLSPAEASVLARSQYTAENNATIANGGASYAPGDPRRGLVDNPALGAQPAAARPAYDANASADLILRGRFGPPPNERGQIDVAPGGITIPSAADTIGAMTDGRPIPQAPTPAPYSLQAAATPRPAPGMSVPLSALPAPATRPGPIDVNSYTGSRYSAANMIPGSRAGLDPNLIGTALDPTMRQANVTLTQQQIQQNGLTATHTQQQIADETARQAQQARNQSAAAAAVRPSINLPSAADVSQAFNSGGTVRVPLAKLDDGTGDLILKYLQAGGNDPAQGQMLVAATKVATPKPVMSFSSKAALDAKYPGDKYDYSFTEDPATGRIDLAHVSPRAPQPTPPNEFANTLDKATGTQVAAVIDKAAGAQDTLEQISKARAALAAGAKTGGLAGAKLSLAQTINGILGDGTVKTTATELGDNAFKNMALAAASGMKGQGQISDTERKLLGDTVAKLGNTPEAANYIMNFMEAGAKRHLDKAAALQQLRDSGDTTPVKYSKILGTWEKDHPINVSGPAAAAPKVKLPTGWSIKQ